MGTVIFSDTLTDTTLFRPTTMVVGDTLQSTSKRSESTRNLGGLAQPSRLPNAVSPKPAFHPPQTHQPSLHFPPIVLGPRHITCSLRPL